MTTEEKLEHFRSVCMEDAKEHFAQVVSEYRSGLNATLEQHKKDARRRQEMRIEIETGKIEKEIKRELSMDQIKIRRDVSKKQEEYKDRLFEEVEKKLSAYRRTTDYLELLKDQIAKIREFAEGSPCEIYVDPEDKELLPKLPGGLAVSDEGFLGGTIAVIPSMNIFIDNSFRTKLEKEKHEFSFITGGKNGEQ